MYSRATDVPFLTAITLRFAAGIRIAAQEARAIAAHQETQELLRFEEVVEAGDEASKLEGDDDDSVDTDASTDAHLDSGSRRVFRTPSLRPNQRSAIK